MEEGVEITNLTIPAIKGDKGDTGSAGKISSLAITMLASTATPTVTNTGTVYDAHYVLGIPKGTGIAGTEINDDDELIITLSDDTELNVGVVVGSSIESVYIDEEYNLIVTLTDDTEINAGNLETEITNIVSEDYYDKDTADAKFAQFVDLSYDVGDRELTATIEDADHTTLSTNTITLPQAIASLSVTNRTIYITYVDGSTGTLYLSHVQPLITSENKLTADYVDDLTSTNKFVTASEKTQITSNATAITNIKDGISIDSFGDVESNYYNKTAIDSMIGNIDDVLDAINGEVI